MDNVVRKVSQFSHRLRILLADPIRRLQLSLLFLVALAACGTLGYMLLEKMTAVEAFYMTIITITTVGFGEVRPLSPGGRVFTVVLILLGVGGLTAAVSNAAEVVLGQRLWQAVQQRRNETMVKTLTGHYVVCGFGRMGRQVVRDLQARDETFIVVDVSPEVESSFLEEQIPYIIGDGTQDEVLVEARIEHARGLVAVLDTNADNVLTVLTARGLNPNLFIVARATGGTSENKLRRAGADRVVSPYDIGGHRMGLALLRPAVHDFLTRISDISSDLDVDLGQIYVKEGSRLAGQSVSQCDLRQVQNINILAIQRHDGSFSINPNPQRVIATGETLIVIGPAEAVYRIEESLPTKSDQDGE